MPMAEITAQAVHEFRKKTGLGLMECKALLKEAGGDTQKAETLAKERGLKKAELRAGRAAKGGRIDVYIHHDAKSRARADPFPAPTWGRSRAIRESPPPRGRSGPPARPQTESPGLGSQPRWEERLRQRAVRTRCSGRSSQDVPLGIGKRDLETGI